MQFQVAETFLGAGQHLLSGISDIEIVRTSGGLRIYTATRAGGGILVLDVSDKIRLQDQQALASGQILSAPTHLELTTLSGKAQLLVQGPNMARMGGYALESDGDIGSATQILGAPSGAIAAQTMVTLGDKTFLYANRMGDATVLVYQLQSNGRMSYVDELFSHGGFQGVDVTAMETVTLNGKTYLLSLSSGSNALRSFRIEGNGELIAISTLGAAGGLGITTPSAMEIAHFGGASYALVAAAGSSSISVIRLEASGRLSLMDHVVDTLDTRFQGVQAITTVKLGDRLFVFAGGGDDGVNMFTLLPNGRLLLMAEQLQAPGMALDDITAMQAVSVNGKIELFIAGEGSGLTQLRLDPGTLSAMKIGTSGPDELMGGGGADLLSGDADDDTLRGGVGDDILLDGTGTDLLEGGAGADIFVMSGDGQPDTIRDFQVGIDRIDLSAWGRVYSMAAMSISSRAYGMLIRFGSETLRILSSDGAPIAESAFSSADLFGLWHVFAEPVVEGVQIEGSSLRDTLTGDSGDDTLIGSVGADVLDGRAGFDIVDYSAATGPMRLDMLSQGENSNLAAGDLLRSIEGVIAGSGNDSIYGNHEDNLFRGMAGHDLLVGRGGDDLLIGGAGGDTLMGGAGEDRLNGGRGADCASYADARGAVWVDLQNAPTNRGDAAQDQYDSIEDLEGSRFGDHLLGDRAGNRIYGGAGWDHLSGRTGNDQLFGGDGCDQLIGNAGDDLLDGGRGNDWVVLAGQLAVRVDLASRDPQDLGQGVDRLISIENVQGSDKADMLLGNKWINHLRGGGGNDTLAGRDGNDTLDGGLGNDMLRGGNGRDTAIFDETTGAVADLRRTGAQNTGQGIDVLQSIENLAGGSGMDRLTGNSFGNQLSGNGGADWLSGRGGNDMLRGGSGNDTLIGGAGNDTFQGGSGRDLVSFDGNHGVRALLARKGAQDTGAGLDKFVSVEDLQGGGGRDHLTGNDRKNVLRGQAGNDWLWGSGGNDTLMGGDGADTLTGGRGDDALLGGTGVDWASYGGGANYQVNLSIKSHQQTGRGKDLLVGIENIASGAGNDLLTGNNGGNVLRGGVGSDRLHGGGGRDRLEGGTGNDRLWGDDGADIFVYSGGKDLVKDFTRWEDDRLVFDDAQLTSLHGLSATKLINRYAHDLGEDVLFDFGFGQKLLLESAGTTHGLAEYISII